MNKQRILIVDDDPDILRATGLRLRAVGFDTIEATNGEDAVTKANSESPDMVLMDIRMPKKDGITAMKNMADREETKRIPVIISSASLNKREVAIDAGAKGFIPKPYIGKKLVEAVSKVLVNQKGES